VGRTRIADYVVKLRIWAIRRECHDAYQACQQHHSQRLNFIAHPQFPQALEMIAHPSLTLAETRDDERDVDTP
jgi:hypothetical protein